MLAVSQILSGAALAAGITVGALLAEEMLGSTGLAGVPSALFTAGAAAGAAGIGRACQRWGRRPGLAGGYAVGALGSVAVVLATVADSVPLLFAGLLVYGAGTASILLARYAGADLAAPERRGRAVSTVLFATAAGAIAGPNLVGVTGDLAHAWGVPRLAGPFLLAAAAFTAAALFLAALLRPDPLLLSRTWAGAQPAGPAPPPAEEPGSGASGPTAGAADAADAAGGAGPVGSSAQGPPGSARPAGPAEAVPAAGPGPAAGAVDRGAVAAGAAVMILSQLVMISVMTMTPVHMAAHGHSTGAAGLVIGLHLGAMYLSSPLSGFLADRAGRPATAALGALTMCVAGLTAALAPPHSAPVLAAALVLLGVGWNLGFVSGTALVTDALPAGRASAQGFVDVGVSASGAAGGMASGLVVALGGYPVLALGGGILALCVLPLFALATRRRPSGAAAQRSGSGGSP